MKKLILFMILLFTSNVWADDTHNFCAQPANNPLSVVSFPADDGLHVDAQGQFVHVYEQWYWNAVVTGSDGKVYGLETLVFQFNFPSGPFNAIQMSLTDVTTGKYQNDVILGFNGYPIVANGFNNSLSDSTTGASFSSIGGGGRDQLMFHFSDGTVVNLHFEGLKNPSPAFFNGVGSFTDAITNTNHGRQFYYNRRNMAAVGTLQKTGKTKIDILGSGWYDREYGTVIGTPGTQSNDVNWKWASIHLSDGTDYMMWDMKANDTGNSTIHVINEIGQAPLCQETTITNFSITNVGQTLTSSGPPVTVFEPSNHLSIPEQKLELTFTPLVTNQVALFGTLLNPIYEGAIRISGTRNGHHIVGIGYYEQTQNCCQPL